MFNALIAVAAMVAMPQDGPPLFGEVDGWGVFKRSDGCFLMATYDPATGPQEFAVFQEKDGDLISLLFSDASWNFGEGRRDDYGLRFDGPENNPQWNGLTGTENRGEDSGAILIAFDAEGSHALLDDIRGGTAIHLFRDGAEIINLEITGNAPALDMLDQCVDSV